MPEETLRSFVKRRCNALEITQTDVAVKIHMNPANFGVYLGRGSIPRNKIEALAKAINVTPDVIIDHIGKYRDERNVLPLNRHAEKNIMPLVKDLASTLDLETPLTLKNLVAIVELQEKIGFPLTPEQLESFLENLNKK